MNDPNESQLTPDPKKKQQDAAFRYYVRLNHIFFLVVLGVAVVVVAFKPTAPRIAGLVITAALTGASLLIGRVSLRKVGFATLTVAGLTAIVAEFAPPDWPAEPYEIGIWAVSIGALGLTLVFTNKRTGEVSPRLEKGAGLATLLGILIIAGILVWRGSSSITTPAGLVVLEGLAVLADVAGEKWKWRLGLTALLPLAALLIEQASPQWRRITFQGVRSSYAFLSAHTLAWMLWPILFAGLNTLLVCLNRRRGWRAIFVSLLLTVTIVWLILFAFDVML